MSKLAKNNLRRAVKGSLNKLSTENLNQQSKSVYEALIKNDHFCNAKSVALFMSMPKMEVKTINIIEHCFTHNKNVFLPKCLPPTTTGSSMTFLQVNNLSDVNALQPAGRYNLREPSHGENVMTSGMLDVIIVPGVAFTLQGDRLGHGAGYYDKFLTNFKEKFGRVPYLIGVCLADQLVKTIPTEPHDWTMDQVIVAEDNN